MDRTSRIWVAGHSGLLGSALCRLLAGLGYEDVATRTHAGLELTDPTAVAAFFEEFRPEYVFLAAGLAGGILRNRSQPADLIRTNLAIQTTVIHQAYLSGVKKLLFVGSGCAYPKDVVQPIRPESLMAGPVECTSEPFAVSKIAGIRMCQAYNAQYGAQFISVVPSTMYGPNDHFDENGHVASALVARFHQAKVSGASSVEVWGTGRPRRELLYVDDAAEAMVFLMRSYEGSEIVNVGSGVDVSIAELAEEVARTVGFEGEVSFDTSKPDGMPQRLLDCGRIHEAGWLPSVSLAEGLARTYAWFVEHASNGEER